MYGHPISTPRVFNRALKVYRVPYERNAIQSCRIAKVTRLNSSCGSLNFSLFLFEIGLFGLRLQGCGDGSHVPGLQIGRNPQEIVLGLFCIRSHLQGKAHTDLDILGSKSTHKDSGAPVSVVRIHEE